MLCKTKFTEKYEKNFELYKTLDNYACIFDIMLRKGLCSFLNDNESYNGQSSYGKNTHLLDIKQSKLFDFVHLFKDNIGHKLLSYDGDNNFLLENHSLNLSEIVGDDKILVFQFSDNQKEKERIEDTVRFTHNLLNNCYRRWDCWHSILLQSIQIHLDDYDPLPGNGLFEGVQMFNSNELSEIGKMLVGASLKVVELGSIFIKKLKSEFKDPFSNVYEMEKHIFVQDLLIFDLEKIYNIILGMEEFSHRHAEYFKSFEEYKKLYDS